MVIGGFSVIYHGYVRARKDSDLLVPDGAETDGAVLRFLERVRGTRLRDGKTLTPQDIAGAENVRVNPRHGIIDQGDEERRGSVSSLARVRSTPLSLRP